MNILDKNGNLLAMIIKEDNMPSSKFFATENSQELQVAKFNLEEGTEIERHIHLQQERTIFYTSEVIVITDGEMFVEIFDEKLNLITQETLLKGDILAMFKGGHGLKMGKNCNFIEVKQGPYLEEIDKKRF